MNLDNRITIGSITMTYDAFATLIIGFIFAIIVKLKYPNLNNLIYLYILLMYSLSAYHMNCMIVGSCILWVRFLIIISIITIISFTITGDHFAIRALS